MMNGWEKILTVGFQSSFHQRSKSATVLRDMTLIGVLLGWWIPGIINQSTRHYWIITTVTYFENSCLACLPFFTGVF